MSKLISLLVVIMMLSLMSGIGESASCGTAAGGGEKMYISGDEDAETMEDAMTEDEMTDEEMMPEYLDSEDILTDEDAAMLEETVESDVDSEDSD